MQHDGTSSDCSAAALPSFSVRASSSNLLVLYILSLYHTFVDVSLGRSPII